MCDVSAITPTQHLQKDITRIAEVTAFPELWRHELAA